MRFSYLFVLEEAVLHLENENDIASLHPLAKNLMDKGRAEVVIVLDRPGQYTNWAHLGEDPV